LGGITSVKNVSELTLQMMFFQKSLDDLDTGNVLRVIDAKPWTKRETLKKFISLAGESHSTASSALIH
jgi:hypothetical protein